LRADAVVSISLPRVVTEAFLPYTSFVVILAILFGGGGNQGWSDALVQLAALPLLAWALFKLSPLQLDRHGQWAIGLLCAIFAWPLLQLIPMPPSLWSDLPGREAIGSAYETAGIPLPWLPISLDPSATWLGLLSLLPAAAVFLAMLLLDQRARRVLVILIFIGVFANVLLDILQTVGGYNSPLRFYAITNLFRPVGLFANSNHNAAFLYCTLPFATAWAIGLMLEHRQNRAVGLAWLALLILMIIIGVTLTQSRAGIVLLVVAGLASLLLVWWHARASSGRHLLGFAAGACVLGLLVAFHLGFVGFMERVQGQGFEDARWSIAKVTSRAAIANLPFGSGIGTFVPVYDELAPRTLLGDTYVNHAHNDWLELWLTAGAPAMILAVGFLVWLAGATFRLWGSGQPSARALDLVLARAAPIAIVLLLLHSAVDFPLRIPTLSVLFAIACGYLIAPRRSEHGTAIEKVPVREVGAFS
jgi:O-antigen ligase